MSTQTRPAASTAAILIDANNLGFAALHGTKQRLMSGDTDTTGAYGFLRSLRMIRQDFAGDMYILWDGKSWRYDEALKNAVIYKGNRETTQDQVESRDEWRASRVLLAPLLRGLGIKQMVAANLEADDLAARLRHRIPGEILLVSSDHDWLALINERVSVYDHRNRRRITLANFKEMTGYDNPRQIVEAKALTGDSSDNIPGVGGIGEKTAKEIFETFGSVQSFLNACMGDPTMIAKAPKRAVKFLDSIEKQDIYKANLRLVDLDHPDAPPSTKITFVPGIPDDELFRQTCEELAFFSITRGFDAWVAPFRQTA